MRLHAKLPALSAVLLLLVSGCASVAPARAQEPRLPAAAESALARLNASPRHAEWQMVRSGDDSVRVFVVYPESDRPAPVVLVVHEIFGLSHWVRAVADQLAAHGFIAVAPDLLTMRDVRADASGEPDRQQATAQIRTLDAGEVHRWLGDVARWAMALPAATDRYGIVGFCWGGSTSFRHAVESADVDAAVVYYGTAPDTALLARIRAPVLGLYGGNDARVNATIPAADSAMTALGRSYDVHIFDGAGHGFLRQQGGQEGANLAASRDAWPLTIEFFRQHLF